jgi:MFS family permease
VSLLGRCCAENYGGALGFGTARPVDLFRHATAHCLPISDASQCRSDRAPSEVVATTRLAGRLADRAGAAVTAAGATALYLAVLLMAFVFPGREPPALAVFVGFMAASGLRAVPMQALASRVPAPEERARFMSAQSVVQHLGSAAGAVLASSMLWSLPGGRLGGMVRVASVAAVLAAAVPGLLWALERRVRLGEASGRPAAMRPHHAPAAAPSSQPAR